VTILVTDTKTVVFTRAQVLEALTKYLAESAIYLSGTVTVTQSMYYQQLQADTDPLLTLSWTPTE